MHGIRRGIVAASVQEAVGGGFLKGWCVIMRHGPPASHATPSVCARGLHMPPPAKVWVSSRSGERCQEKEGDVGQNVQGLQGAARRRTRPVRRLPATRAARREKTPVKKTRKSVSKRRSIRHSRTPRGRCSARRSSHSARRGRRGRQSRCLAHDAPVRRNGQRPTRCAPWCKILCSQDDGRALRAGTPRTRHQPNGRRPASSR